jgi:hypothetical protein
MGAGPRVGQWQAGGRRTVRQHGGHEQIISQILMLILDLAALMPVRYLHAVAAFRKVVANSLMLAVDRRRWLLVTS